MLPLLVQPAQPEDNGSAFDFVGAAMGPDQPSPFASLLGSLQGSLQDIQNRPGPAMMDVPPQANPYGSFLATIAAGLADQLGQHGTVENIQGRAAGMEKRRQVVEDYNRTLTEQDREQRIKDAMQMQSHIIDVSLAEAQRMGDLTKIRKELSARLAMDKEMQRLDAIEKEKERVKDIQVAMLNAGSKPKAGDVEAGKIQTALTTANNGIEAILGDPQSYESVSPSMMQGLNPMAPKIKGTRLKPEAAKRAQDYALSEAQSSPYPEVRQAMLFRYAETLRDPTTGQINKTSPAFAALIQKLQTLMPDAQDRQAFYTMLGL